MFMLVNATTIFIYPRDTAIVYSGIIIYTRNDYQYTDAQVMHSFRLYNGGYKRYC